MAEGPNHRLSVRVLCLFVGSGLIFSPKAAPASPPVRTTVRRIVPTMVDGKIPGRAEWQILASGQEPPGQPQADQSEELVGLLEVPSPDLGKLEEAVAVQLRDMRALLLSRLEGSELSVDQLATTYGDLGRLYHAYELTDSAEACYLNAKQLSPLDFQWPHYLGHLYMTAGRLDQAKDNFEDALSLRPARVATLVGLGQVCLEMNRLDEAEAHLTRALELAPDSAAASAALGEIALSRQDFQTAIDYLTTALELAPAANRLHYPLAMAYRGLGDLERARTHLAQRGTVGVRPDDPLMDELTGAMEGEMIHLLRGKMAFAAGQYTDAAEEFRQAAMAKPDSARAKINLGSALGLLGDTEGAIEQYREALWLAPKNAAAHFNLGYLLAQQGEYADAEFHLRAAVEIEPLDGVAHFELAEVLRRRMGWDEALAQYSRVIELAPRNELARLGQAEMLVQKGRYAEAERALDAALAMMPASGLIAHSLARLLAACPDLGVRNGERALDLGIRVYQASATVSHSETVAMAMAEMGRCEEAAEWQRNAISGAKPVVSPERLEDLQAGLAHYESGAPCRFPTSPIWNR